MNGQRVFMSVAACCVVLVTGCGSTIPMVSKAQRCEVDSAILTSNCATPQQLAAETTYQQMVTTMLEERQALLRCGAAFDALRDSLNRCNQKIDEFNADVARINRENEAAK